MRVLPVVSLLAAVAVAAPRARAQEPALTTTTTAASTTTTTLPPPPEQHVTILGTPPDLTGRWLVVGDLAAGGAGHRATVAFWEVTRADGRLDLQVRTVGLPPALQAALDAAGNRGEAWSPTADDLAAIAADWERLAVQYLPIGRIDTEIAGPDGLDEGMKSDATTKDAIWVVRQGETFLPSGAPMLRQALVYAALGPSDDGYTGNYAILMLAAAPFPIPIALKGTFHAYRLSTPSRGVLARILDVFKGCGAGRTGD